MTGAFLVGRLPGGSVFGIASRRAGDLSLRNAGPDAVEARRGLGVAMGRDGSDWVGVSQVHGTTIREAGAVVGRRPSVEGDGVVCRPGERVVGVVVAADCLPVAVAGTRGSVVAVHAGWNGLLAGVLEAAVAALCRDGEEPAAAVVGPAIGPCCYEFGAPDLDRVAARFGPRVRSRTRSGSLALDLRAGAEVALGGAGVPSIRYVGGCTGCDAGWYSWRARRERGRHGLGVAPGA